MSLFHFIMDRWQQRLHWEELVEDLATACARRVRSRLSEQVNRMSRHECRGYVKARAAAVVNSIVEREADREGIASRLIPQLQARVLEATTRIVQQNLVAEQAWVGLRRAA